MDLGKTRTATGSTDSPELETDAKQVEPPTASTHHSATDAKQAEPSIAPSHQPATGVKQVEPSTACLTAGS